ncbi:MAG: MoaD/ThiS family protein [Isosphaeraceae bacterium]
MPVVFIPTPLRALTGGQPEVRVEGKTVRELIAGLEHRFPGVDSRLRRGDALAPGLHVSIDHVMTTRGLEAPVGPDSEVHFLPAIGGGSDP